MGRESLKQISIPSSVTEVGEDIFIGCTDCNIYCILKHGNKLFKRLLLKTNIKNFFTYYFKHDIYQITKIYK